MIISVDELKNICKKLLCVNICHYYSYHIKADYKNDNCFYFNNYNIKEDYVLEYNGFVIRYDDIKKITINNNELTIYYNINGEETNLSLDLVYKN